MNLHRTLRGTCSLDYLPNHRSEWNKLIPKQHQPFPFKIRAKTNPYLVEFSEHPTPSFDHPIRLHHLIEIPPWKKKMNKEAKVKLISAEGFEFVIDKEAAMVSQTIRNMLTSPGFFFSLLFIYSLFLLKIANFV